MKKNGLRYLLFGLFVISLIGMAVHIFPEIRGAQSRLPQEKIRSRLGRFEKVAEVSLGKVEIRGFRQMGSTPGLVRLAPSGQRFVVGTESGEVLVYDLTGKLLWNRRIGMGKISALEFSPDSKRIFLGENSQQGSFIAVDTQTGAELWRKNSSEELGMDIRQRTFPGIMSIVVDEQGNAFAAALRSIRYPSGKTEYFARVYRVDPSGVVQKIPRDHNLDVWVSWCDVDPAGEMLVFGTSDYTPGPQRQYQDNIYRFNARSGEKVWSLAVPTVEPYERTNMRFGPKLSTDGKKMGGVSADGRGFFVDANGQLLWSRTLSSPQRIQGVFVNATGLHVQFVGGHAIFSTGNTYNRANWQLPTPVEHPQSNSVFVFDPTGGFKKRRAFGGMIEEMKVSGTNLAVAVGRNIRTKDVSVHGVAVLTAPELDMVDWMPTEGPCVAIAVNPENLLAMEAPLQHDNGEVIGVYRIHIWRKTGTL